MKLLPDSIRTRTILVLLVGLTVSHIASTVVSSPDVGPSAASPTAQVDRLALLAGLVAATPAPRRPALADAISTPEMRFSWSPDPPAPMDHHEDATTEPLLQALRANLADRTDIGPPHVLAAQIANPDWWRGQELLHSHRGAIQDRHWLIELPFADASWLAIHLHTAEPASAWSRQSLISTLVMLLGTLVISIWATRWITAPLASFAGAAERLGRDVTATPLAEDGSKEVRAAARAFNLMQSRIRSFVEDRVQMLAAISHDLRTPITRLKLRIEQLPIEEPQQTKLLSDLDEMEQMVASCLAFAKDEASDEPAQAFDLAALIASICDDMADAGQDAKFDWNERLVFHGRPLAMKRLFVNLLENAVRYGLRARVVAAASETAITVRIEDDGPGIPEDRLDAVFKPFYRLDASRNRRTGGLGVGLANVRSIARAHGGDVVLANRSPGGLCATVVLPLGSNAPQSPSSRQEKGR